MRAQRFQPGRSAAASGSSDEPGLRSGGPLAPRNPGFSSPLRFSRFRSSARQILALGLIFLAAHLLQASAAEVTQPFRVGFSSRMFFEVNENDAKAGFDIMNELNPQIGKQLAMVASSPDFVPAVFALRADYQPTFRDKIIEGLRQLHQSPGGQQILTIFQSDAVELRPPSFLDTSLELLRTHARLCGTEASNPVANPTASTFTEVRTVPAASDRQQIKGQP